MAEREMDGGGWKEVSYVSEEEKKEREKEGKEK